MDTLARHARFFPNQWHAFILCQEILHLCLICTERGTSRQSGCAKREPLRTYNEIEQAPSIYRGMWATEIIAQLVKNMLQSPLSRLCPCPQSGPQYRAPTVAYHRWVLTCRSHLSHSNVFTSGIACPSSRSNSAGHRCWQYRCLGVGRGTWSVNFPKHIKAETYWYRYLYAGTRLCP